jgi:Tfp pilus assembly protein PilN
MLADADYQSVKGFTGKDAVAAKVSGVGFPTLLEPIDDLPPATMIRSVRKQNGKLIVTGLSQDNEQVAAISVNGVTATTLSATAGVTEWRAEIEAPADGIIAASAIDCAGNVKERSPLERAW